MNKLEIFQAAYGKDYAFTETELIKLMTITKLIVRECIDTAYREGDNVAYLANYFGVDSMTGFNSKRKMAADKQAATVGSLAPTRLWLDFGVDPSEELDGVTLEDLDEETTVSYGKPTQHGIEYVRADLVSPPQRKPLTDADYVNACISYRHDFGLMTQEQRDKLIFQAREWARAFGINEVAHGIKENT